MKKSKIEKYIKYFREYINPHLRPNTGIYAHVVPYDNGAIVEFEFKLGSINKDEYKERVSNAASALKILNIKEFGENPNQIRFQGTNILMTKDKIFYIKDNTPDEWFKASAHKDVKKILHPVENN